MPAYPPDVEHALRALAPWRNPRRQPPWPPVCTSADLRAAGCDPYPDPDKMATARLALAAQRLKVFTQASLEAALGRERAHPNAGPLIRRWLDWGRVEALPKRPGKNEVTYRWLEAPRKTT